MSSRVFITTDIGGGDPDDGQSFAHLLWYSDLLDIVGVSCGHPKGKISVALQFVEAYRKDYKRYQFAKYGLINPETIRKRCYKGSEGKGYTSLTTGIRKLVKASKEGPLVVLVWGSCTDLAAAIKHGAKLENITAHIIASWNREQDPGSHKAVLNANLHKVIVNESTFRGMYLAAPSMGRMGNRGFIETVVKECGALGQLMYDISANINVGRYSLKAGDTGSTIWALDEVMGNKPRWGGYFPEGKDSQDPQFKLGVFAGAALLARQRKRWLGNWIDRLERFYDLGLPSQKNPPTKRTMP